MSLSFQSSNPLLNHYVSLLALGAIDHSADRQPQQLLSDYGASIVKVEQPVTGDETRQWRTHGEGEFWKSGPQYDLMSLYFCAVNRNKRSITVNLKSEVGRDVVRRLIAEGWDDGNTRGKGPVDVVVHNFLPGKIEQMGLGYDQLRSSLASRVSDRLIYASISGYGATGPSANRAGYDAIALAEAGLLHITGTESSGPVKPGVAIADLCTGLYTASAILAAVNQRHNTGHGTEIQGSLFESSLSLLINVGLASLNLDNNKGPEKRRKGKRLGLGHPNLVPYGGYTTSDGRMIFIAANNNRQWTAFCSLLGISATLAQKFATNDSRVENREDIDALLTRKFKEKTKQEWMEKFQGSGLPYGAINDIVEAVKHPQAEARGMVTELTGFEAARDGWVKLLGPAMSFGEGKAGVRLRPPILGEHTDDVLRGLGYNEQEVAGLRVDGIV
jgi:succinate---hydroxymethylglutarate CoA-transferase